MCAGATYWTQLKKIVFGAYDLKTGYSQFNKDVLHSKTKVKGGVMENKCAKLLTDFFKLKR